MKKYYSNPKFVEIGHLHSFIQLGNKTGSTTDGEGGEDSEEAMDMMFTNTDFSRSSSSSDSSGGRSGRN